MKSLRFSFALLVAMFSVSAFAQTGASISGTATDSSGAVVDGALVTVTNEGTGSTRSVTTNASGFYSVPNLAPGAYTITVEKQGFSTVGLKKLH